ncbi:reverse transcriptase domain-containing protein [Tanacetum coccineum]
MGTPTQYLCDYWSGWVRIPRLSLDYGPVRGHINNCKRLWILVTIRTSLEFVQVFAIAEEGERVGRSRRDRRHREGNDEHVDELNGQGNDQGLRANWGVEGVNGNVEGANRGAPDFSTIISQQLQNLLPAMLAQIHTLSREVVVSMSWNDFKFVMIQEFCPSHEMQNLKSELWNHAMVGAGHAAYTDRFHELARLVPHLVTPESMMIDRYVYGIAPQIGRMVAATEPKTIQKAV